MSEIKSQRAMSKSRNLRTKKARRSKERKRQMIRSAKCRKDLRMSRIRWSRRMRPFKMIFKKDKKKPLIESGLSL